MRRALLLTIFVLTGATALGYQLVWARMLANTLGHEMRAVLVVVTGFMGGMTLGAWWLGKLAQRGAFPGRWYAGLEMFIGLWAMLVPVTRPWLLIPPAVAMGASFPAMVRFMQGRGIGGLYAANTLGAVIGVVAVTWWLLPAVGLKTSAMTLGIVNIVAGVAAWGATNERREAEPEDWGSERRTLGMVFVTGFIAIGFEVLGVRVLAQVMENTVYSFAAALAVYLLGTSLGAAWYHRFGKEQLLDNLLGTAVIVCLGSIMVMGNTPTIYNGLRGALGDSVPGVAAAEVTLSACVFLLPTMFMGAIFSLLMQREARRFSTMLAVNTLGSAFAAGACSTLLLPVIGGKWALVLIAVTYFALLQRWKWFMPAVAGGMIVFLPTLRFVQVPPGDAIVDYREGMMASIAVVRDATGNRTLKVNNRFQMGGTSAAETEYRQAHLPLKLHPKPERALFLGTGTGITFGAATLYPGLQADGVELLPEVVDVMHSFKPHNFMDDYGERLRMHVADARRFVQTGTNLYDVIVADLFHPARDGAGTLYTKEHFSAIRERLSENGLFCQWLPLHQMDEGTLRIVIRTFLKSFPNSRAYLLHWSVDVPVLGLVASDRWKPDTDRLAGGVVAGAEGLRRFAGSGPINTDDHQIVTYAAPQFSYRRNATSYGRLTAVLQIEPPKDDFLRARNFYLHGLVKEMEGEISAGIDAYIESAKISPAFTMGYARCITLAAAAAKDRPEAARALLKRLIQAKPDERLAHELLERLFSAAPK